MQRDMDGDLDEAEYQVMQEHIKTCEDCAGVHERLLLLSDELQELPKVEPPFSLVDAILPQLEQLDPELESSRIRSVPKPIHGKGRKKWLFPVSGGAAAAALIIALALNPNLFHPQATSSADALHVGSPSAQSSAAQPMHQAKASNAEHFSSSKQMVPSAEGSKVNPGVSPQPTEESGPITLQPSAQDQYGNNIQTTSPGNGTSGSAPSGQSANSNVKPDNTVGSSAMQPSDQTGDNQVDIQGESSQNRTNVMLMSAVPLAVSPDHTYTATVTDNHVVVEQAGKQVFVSAHKISSGDHVANIKWISNSELTYDFYADGSQNKTTYRIDLQQKTETQVKTSGK